MFSFAASVFAILNGILIFVLNFIVVFYSVFTLVSTKFGYQNIVNIMAIVHILTGLILVSMAGVDFSLNETFIFVEYIWPQSLSCIFIYLLSTLNYILDELLIFVVTLARCMVVYFPLNTRFKNKSYIAKVLLFSIFTVVTCSVCLTYYRYRLLVNRKNRLCSPIDKDLSENSALFISAALGCLWRFNLSCLCCHILWLDC